MPNSCKNSGYLGRVGRKVRISRAKRDAGSGFYGDAKTSARRCGEQRQCRRSDCARQQFEAANPVESTNVPDSAPAIAMRLGDRPAQSFELVGLADDDPVVALRLVGLVRAHTFMLAPAPDRRIWAVLASGRTFPKSPQTAPCKPSQIERPTQNRRNGSTRWRAMRESALFLAPKARSSVGEHFPDTEGVGGSNPPVPTILFGSELQ